jgi:solute carrier family 35 protein F1/2
MSVHRVEMLDQDLKLKTSESGHSDLEAPLVTVSERPPIVYSSPRAFAKSFAARWRSVWTKPFIMAFLAGQVVSLCITCTNVTTTELVNRGWTLSTTQGLFLYVLLFVPFNVFALSLLTDRYFTLFLVYTPYTIYQCMGFSVHLRSNAQIVIARRVQGLGESDA